MKNEIIDNIEKELSILLDKLGEERYIEFIKGNILLSIYDIKQIFTPLNNQIDDELYSSYIFDKRFLVSIYQFLKSNNEFINSGN